MHIIIILYPRSKYGNYCLIPSVTFCTALSLKPGDALTLKRRADVLGKQGKQEEAIADYKLAVEIQTMKRVRTD